LEHFSELGLLATGHVGDEDPYLAVVDSLSAQHFDAVVVSTLPARVSAWLRLDVVSRLRRHFALPVVHLAARDTATAGAGASVPSK
jgi:GABA permease